MILNYTGDNQRYILVHFVALELGLPTCYLLPAVYVISGCNSSTVFHTLERSHRRRSDVSFSSHIGRDVADHAETSSRRLDWYVNEKDLVETSHWYVVQTDQKS